MRHLIVIAAGLGFRNLEKQNRLHQAGLDFKPAQSTFPAVTCTAQATFRTATEPREHGMTSNGFYSRTLQKPAFWEQSAALVEGPRIWDAARTAGQTVGLYFWQQSLGENVDSLISPAPIHKHGGGMIMRNYALPAGMGEKLDRTCGTFPLHHYWGPLASAKVGRAVLDNFFAMMEGHSPDIALLYLPSLDYEAQRHGPGSAADIRAHKEFTAQLERLADYAQHESAALTVLGDYEIASCDKAPVTPNAKLRTAGYFNVRDVAGRAYPDFYTSRAFAMCDHEVAHVYVKNPDDVKPVAHLFESTGDYESCTIRANQDWAHPSAGEILLLAKAGSWCAYPWWTNPREAPDWATHIDIHNKPGYDPCELFFGKLFPPGTCQDGTRIKGSHGRPSTIAWASTEASLTATTTRNLALSLQSQL